MLSKRWNDFFRNLKYKYRLVIYNESTFETEGSYLLSKLNIILAISLIFLISVIFSILLITYSPIKYYIPGYGDAGMRKQLRNIINQTDEIQDKLEENDLYFKNIQQVLKGDLPSNKIFDPSKNSEDSIK